MEPLITKDLLPRIQYVPTLWIWGEVRDACGLFHLGRYCSSRWGALGRGSPVLLSETSLSKLPSWQIGVGVGSGFKGQILTVLKEI